MHVDNQRRLNLFTIWLQSREVRRAGGFATKAAATVTEKVYFDITIGGKEAGKLLCFAFVQRRKTMQSCSKETGVWMCRAHCVRSVW